MLVKYIGKESVITEYNGQKYSFSVKNPIKDIPYEVYDFFKQSGQYYAHLLVPYIATQDKHTEGIAKKAIVEPVDIKPKYVSKKEEKPKKTRVRKKYKKTSK